MTPAPSTGFGNAFGAPTAFGTTNAAPAFTFGATAFNPNATNFTFGAAPSTNPIPGFGALKIKDEEDEDDEADDE